MSLKKNALSYIIWVIMLLFTGAGVAFLGLVATRMLAGENILIAVGIIAVFFLVLFLIYLLTGYLIKQIDLSGIVNRHSQVALYMEGVLIGLCISAAFALRIYLMPYAGEEAVYFDIAKVTSQGNMLIQSVQGSVYYYCMLLHGLLRIFGNYWEVGIWLQIILQTFFGILMYFGIRRMTGKLPAILVLIFICFAPVSVSAGITYSPQMLYLCLFGGIFLLLADYMCRSARDTNPIGMWVYTIILGILIGFTWYVDVTGLLLLLPLVCIGMVNGTVGRAMLSFLRFIVFLFVSFSAFAGMIFLDAVLSHSEFLRVLNAWYVTYSTIDFNLSILTEEKQMELLLLLILVFIGVFSFWRRKKEEIFTPYVLLVVGMCLLYLTGVTVENMNGSYLLYVLLAALAGVAVSELFYRERMGKQEQEKEIPETVNKSNEEKVEIIDLEMNERTTTENKMIENPLPVPKKKERKGMDYAYQPKPSEMMYDIRVSDTDDYDIK